jgi:hypothetical protein
MIQYPYIAYHQLQLCGELTNIAIDGEEVPIVENNLDKVVVIDPRPIKTTDFNLTASKRNYW